MLLAIIHPETPIPNPVDALALRMGANTAIFSAVAHKQQNTHAAPGDAT
jgi:hypothetical protein